MSFESGSLNAMGVGICGTISKRNVDKFGKCGFTPVPGPETCAPIIKECPVAFECKVVEKARQEDCEECPGLKKPGDVWAAEGGSNSG